MKSRRRFSRKFVISAGILTVFLSAYLYFGLLPGGLKDATIQEISKYTDKKLYFTKALYLPFEGFSLHQVKITDKNGFLLFSAKKLAINVRILPFFTDKKIMISNLYLDSPVIELQTSPKKTAVVKPPIKTQISGQIDVPVISDQKKVALNALPDGGFDAFLPENVYLEQIEILNGLVTVRKDALSPVAEEINSINIRMGFQKPPKLSFDGSLKLGHTPYATIHLKGDWDLNKANYEFYLDTKSDYVPSWLLDYQKKRFLILKNSKFSLSTHLKSVNETLAIFHSKAILKNTEITAGNGIYKGEMALDVEGAFNFNTKHFDRYRGVLDLKNVDVQGLTQAIDSLKNVNGQIRFQPDLLQFVNVTGVYKNIPFQTVGSLTSFKELKLDETILVNANIQDVLSLVPDNQKKLIKDLTFQGRCQAVTTVIGSLRQADQLKVDYKLHIEDGIIENAAKKIRADGISGDILMNADGVQIKNARFILAKKNYSLEALIPKKPGAPGSLKLLSEDLRLEGSCFLNENDLAVKNAHIETRGITADFHGKIYDFQDPFCDVAGQMEIRLDKAAESFAKEAPFFKTAGLKGTLGGPFALKGLWNHPLDWDLKADLGSPLLFVSQSIRLLGFEVQARMKNRLLQIPFFRASGYQGNASGEAIFNLLKPEIRFDAKLRGHDIDLGLLVQDLNPAKKDVDGKLSAQVSMGGILGSQESFQGSGSLSIHNGRLFKTDLFKQMGNLPFVKVEGLDVVEFTNVDANFTIHDKKAWTQDLRLLSETVDLSLEGTVDFNQTLDMIMNVRYSEAVIRGAYDTGGLVPFVVQQAENLISQYKVSGTLKEPRYDKILI